MMKIGEEFGKEYGVEYNPTKTVCIRFSKKKGPTPEIHLSGTPLKWVKSVKDLGIFVDSDLRVRHKRGDLIGRVNTMMANLGKCPDNVIRKVFNTQCVHLYGAQAWNLTDGAIKDFQVMWNRCIRWVLEAHFATHTRYLPHLIGTKKALDQISERFVKLVNTMQDSNNPKVTNIVQVYKNTASSIISMNSDFISKHLGVERTAVWDLNKVKSTRKGLTEGDQTTVEIIKELREVLNGKCNISVLSREEVRDLLDYLCTG